MPLYHYQCTNENCQEQVIVSHGMNDKQERLCTKCSSSLRKVLPTVTSKSVSVEDINKKNNYKQAVSEAKNDLEQTKQELKGRTWK